jgi:hypothetical protein
MGVGLRGAVVMMAPIRTRGPCSGVMKRPLGASSPKPAATQAWRNEKMEPKTLGSGGGEKVAPEATGGIRQ